jgi:hypothetical protein
MTGSTVGSERVGAYEQRVLSPGRSVIMTWSKDAWTLSRCLVDNELQDLRVRRISEGNWTINLGFGERICVES